MKPKIQLGILIILIFAGAFIFHSIFVSCPLFWILRPRLYRCFECGETVECKLYGQWFCESCRELLGIGDYSQPPENIDHQGTFNEDGEWNIDDICKDDACKETNIISSD